MSNKFIEIDIDSDILRCLTFLDILQDEHGFVEREKVKNKDHLLYNNFGYFCNTLKLIKLDQLHIGINDTVFQESKHSKSLVNFMKKYAYFPNINAINHQQYSDEAERLAYAYCSPYKIESKKYKAPMKSKYSSSAKKYTPVNDAFGMAYATIEGRCFLTANGKDLIFDEKNINPNHDRSRGVVAINILNGYYKTQPDGSFIVPKPIHLHDFGAIIKNDINNLVVSSSFRKMIRADQILTDEAINDPSLFEFNEQSF